MVEFGVVGQFEIRVAAAAESGCGKSVLPGAAFPQWLEAALISWQLWHEWNSCPSRLPYQTVFPQPLKAAFKGEPLPQR
jgi:hypothetical protein